MTSFASSKGSRRLEVEANDAGITQLEEQERVLSSDVEAETARLGKEVGKLAELKKVCQPFFFFFFFVLLWCVHVFGQDVQAV